MKHRCEEAGAARRQNDRFAQRCGADRRAAHVTQPRRHERPALAAAIGLASIAAMAAILPPPRAADEPAAAVAFTDAERREILRLSPLGPPPPDPTNRFADDPAAAHLGQFLFFEPGLSGDGTLSCASCHDPAKSFADGRPLAEGVGVGRRHTPALWNVAYQRWFFWDGRADSLWAQIIHPIEDAAEMGGSRLQAAHHAYTRPELRKVYEAAFGPMPEMADRSRFAEAGGPSASDEQPRRAWEAMDPADRRAVNQVIANLGKAIAAYERKLISADAPFDRFVEGLRNNDSEKLAALSPAAQRGLKLFVGRANCTLCHSGPNFTDGEFHNILLPAADGGKPRDPARYDGARRVKSDPFNAAGGFSDAPDGAAALLVRSLDTSPRIWGEFKVPSLRNVARTAPYMHEGQFATLRDVLQYYSTLEGAVQMGHHKTETLLQPLKLAPGEIDDLLAFLESLTDEAIPPELTRPPASPSAP